MQPGEGNLAKASRDKRCAWLAGNLFNNVGASCNRLLTLKQFSWLGWQTRGQELFF